MARDDDADNKPALPGDNEAILMALDQISQTIDVMTSVVGRLRHYVEEQELTRDTQISEVRPSDQTLH